MSLFAFSSSIGLLFRGSFIYEDGKRSIKKGFLKADFEQLKEKLEEVQSIEIGLLFPGRIFMVGRNGSD